MTAGLCAGIGSRIARRRARCCALSVLCSLVEVHGALFYLAVLVFRRRHRAPCVFCNAKFSCPSMRRKVEATKIGSGVLTRSKFGVFARTRAAARDAQRQTAHSDRVVVVLPSLGGLIGALALSLRSLPAVAGGVRAAALRRALHDAARSRRVRVRRVRARFRLACRSLRATPMRKSIPPTLPTHTHSTNKLTINFTSRTWACGRRRIRDKRSTSRGDCLIQRRRRRTAILS
jgi:hypothetical protein